MNLQLRRETWEAILGHEWDDPLNQMSEIESDNGIALDELVKFCESRSIKGEVGHDLNQNDIFCCCIFDLINNGDWIGEGKTPAEAICRAIIEAAKAVK